MAAFPLLTHSRRAILLGGVSLLALQGVAGCAQKQPAQPPVYNTPTTPPTDATTGGLISQVDGGVYTQTGPVAADTGSNSDSYVVPATGSTVTTLAVGEEDGTGPIPVEPDGGIGDGAGPPPFATTEAVGEEDGGGVYTPGDTGTVTTLALGEEDGSIYAPTDPGIATTLAIGEEDGGGVYTPGDTGTVTTLALGEEDGSIYTPTDPGTATTLALGEEDGAVYDLPADPGTPTTLAIGEEDGGGDLYAPTDPGIVTTLAIGEEDGSGPVPEEPYRDGTAQSYEPDPILTTLAVGEEDGTGPIPVEPDGGIGDGAGPIPVEPYGTAIDDGTASSYEQLLTVTTLAVGEEG